MVIFHGYVSHNQMVCINGLKSVPFDATFAEVSEASAPAASGRESKVIQWALAQEVKAFSYPLVN